ncbi:MAG TPA: DUF488 family protein [Casimicrobiaceae bacterium]|nr:DUF488 family protein [Casimicrobiaceae bacterium]
MNEHVTTKRVYGDHAASDGTRVLVDRIWPRGLTRQRAAQLRELLDRGPVTLLYGARDDAHDDAVALLRYLDARPQR